MLVGSGVELGEVVGTLTGDAVRVAEVTGVAVETGDAVGGTAVAA